MIKMSTYVPYYKQKTSSGYSQLMLLQLSPLPHNYPYLLYSSHHHNSFHPNYSIFITTHSITTTVSPSQLLPSHLQYLHHNSFHHNYSISITTHSITTTVSPSQSKGLKMFSVRSDVMPRNWRMPCFVLYLLFPSF